MKYLAVGWWPKPRLTSPLKKHTRYDQASGRKEAERRELFQDRREAGDLLSVFSFQISTHYSQISWIRTNTNPLRKLTKLHPLPPALPPLHAVTAAALPRTHLHRLGPTSLRHPPTALSAPPPSIFLLPVLNKLSFSPPSL